jgi:hypothetical protein
MDARSVDSKRPCADDVSQSGSPSERNDAPALLMRSILGLEVPPSLLAVADKVIE